MFLSYERSLQPSLVGAGVIVPVASIGRDDSNKDVSVYPNSLSRHQLRMRDDGKLDGLPAFWPHLTRSVVGNHLDNDPAVPPVASSLMLGHALPATVEDAAPTTRRFYLTSQRMADKAVAVAAWSSALMAAYQDAGGHPPLDLASFDERNLNWNDLGTT